jgi:hypothetical protein
MREGELGLFGVNALDTVPHPDGDGLLIVGSWVLPSKCRPNEALHETGHTADGPRSLAYPLA